MIVTLIGYRGSGKSSVGTLLSARRGWTCIDADCEIERLAEKTIRDIFEQEGEAAFRERERQVLIDLLSRDNLVVAAGGGAVLNAATRHDMRAAGPVVWLRASAERLHSRITSDDSSEQRRPDLTRAGGLQEVELLLAERTPLYRECATLTVDTDGLTVAEVVDVILKQINHCGDEEH